MGDFYIFIYLFSFLKHRNKIFIKQYLENIFNFNLKNNILKIN